MNQEESDEIMRDFLVAGETVSLYLTIYSTVIYIFAVLSGIGIIIWIRKEYPVEFIVGVAMGTIATLGVGIFSKCIGTLIARGSAVMVLMAISAGNIESGATHSIGELVTENHASSSEPPQSDPLAAAAKRAARLAELRRRKKR